MPTKRLVSFIGDRTPEFKGEIQHMNPKLFKGKVPALADYVISDDPEVVRLFEEKGVIDYAKVQSKEEEPKTEKLEEKQAELSEEKEEQVIPEDWESLPFFTQRSIARKFDSTVNTKEEVVAVLSSQ